MKTTLDCAPCFIRQALDAIRFVEEAPHVQQDLLRDIFSLASRLDFSQSPPFFAQKIHRMIIEKTGNKDPYAEVKKQSNQLALEIVSKLRIDIEKENSPFETALQYAIAGNVIDFGVRSEITREDIVQTIAQATRSPLLGSVKNFQHKIQNAETILYLTDNAGEIIFDRLLIEQLPANKVTVATRGFPVINDATTADARTAGLHDLVPVIDNGSDAPGTILEDCSTEFIERYHRADLVIAKGQGNFETLSQETKNIFFLLKVKCPVIASHSGVALGSHVLIENKTRWSKSCPNR